MGLPKATRIVRSLLIAFSILLAGDLLAQRKEALFVHAEYQFLGYNYVSVGLGYQPKYGSLHFARSHPKYTFLGWTACFSKKLDNNDWGCAVQALALSGDINGPMGLGLEGNYKMVSGKDHFGIKPLIGLSFPIASILYAYNFDLYRVKEERVSQHELILSLRLAVLARRK